MIEKLRYIGKGEYIMMIPMRDMTDYDLAVIALRTGQTHEEIIEELTSRPNSIYVRSDEYYCQQCDKKYKSWAALNKHELTHTAELTQTVDEDNDDA